MVECPEHITYDSNREGFSAERFVEALLSQAEKRVCIETHRRALVAIHFVDAARTSAKPLETQAMALDPDLIYPAYRYSWVPTGLANTAIELLSATEFPSTERCYARIQFQKDNAADELWVDTEQNEVSLSLCTATQRGIAELTLVVNKKGALLYARRLEHAYELDSGRSNRLVAGENRVLRVCIAERD